MTDEIKFWRYYIPNIDGEGWGIFLLDSTGMFAAVTDYGNYAYRWTHTGCDDFREFFPCSGGYMLGKMAPSRGKEYDDERTIQAIKEDIIQSRREKSFNKDQARAEWDLLEHHSLSNDHEFYLWYEDTNLNEAHEYQKFDYTSSELAFARVLLPRLYEAIKAELTEERQQLTAAN